MLVPIVIGTKHLFRRSESCLRVAFSNDLRPGSCPLKWAAWLRVTTQPNNETIDAIKRFVRTRTLAIGFKLNLRHGSYLLDKWGSPGCRRCSFIQPIKNIEKSWVVPAESRQVWLILLFYFKQAIQHKHYPRESKWFTKSHLIAGIVNIGKKSWNVQ